MEIKIKNFKSVQEVDFSFEKNLTIVGGNGSGKSTILQAVQFAVSCAQSVNYHGISPNSGGNTAGSKYPITPDQLLYSPSKNLETLISFSNSTKTEIEINGSETNRVVFSRGRNRAITTDLTGCNLDVLGNLEQPFSVFVPGLAGISAQEVESSYGYLKKAILYGDSNRYFRNILQKLKDRDSGAFRKLNMHVAKLFDLDEVTVEYNSQSDEFINIYAKKGQKQIPIEIAGTGLLQVLQILAYAYLFKPQILLLDEPDSHLHPDNQHKLLQILDDVATDIPNLHILLSTHSRHMLSGSTNLLWIENGKKRASPSTSTVSILMSMGALDSFKTLAHASQELVLITEDKDNRYLQNILDCAGVDSSKYGKTIFSSEGSSSEDTIYAFTQSITHIPKEKFIVVLDRDAYEDSELTEKKRKIEALGVKVIFTPEYDIEASFCFNNDLVARFLDITPADVSSLIDQILETEKDKVIKDWANARRDAKSKLKHLNTDPGTIAAEAVSKWAASPKKMIKGKFLMKQINREAASSASLDSVLIESDNIFPELIQAITQITNQTT